MAAFSRRHVLIGGAAGLAASALRISPVSAADDALYAAAKKEGALNLYWGSYEQKTIEEIRDAFKAKYPGIEVSLLRQASQTIFTRLRLEIQNDAVQCDSIGTTNLLHYKDLQKLGAIQPFKPTNIDMVPEAFRSIDPENTYHVGAISLTTINQSTSVTAPPTSWTALLDAPWANQITTGSPAFSGDVASWVVAIRKKYGDDFLRAFAKQKPKVGQSNVDTVTDILSGERKVGSAAPFSYSLTQQAAGNPIGVTVPSDDAILNLGLTAVPTKAPHPNAGKLFTDFLYSLEVSNILAKNFWPTLRTDVPWAEGRTLESIKWYRNPVDNLAAEVAEGIAKWKEIVG